MKKRVHVVEDDCCGSSGMHGPGGMKMQMFGKKFGKYFQGIGHHAYQTTDNGNLIITLPVPGILKNTIKIRAKPDKMTLKAERKPELKDVFGSKDIHKVIDLDESVKPNSANAKYVDGVLTITFPLESPGYEVEDINYE
ncbi:MAG: Hsp20/alpha crystallin family protein [Candidatus Kariarchaeaceae archaeon]|jgi:HSP20 family molecular chaperone IbpA